MRGLLCIEPLYHKIVAGEKTQTRRSGGLEVINDWPDEWGVAAAGMTLYPHDKISSILFVRKGVKRGELTDADNVIFKPRYRVGEVLYLKEPIFHENWTANGKEFSKIHYKFDNSRFSHPSVKWSNKLFMPASAARAFIKITGIRCERLLDISDQDCVAEGIELADGSGPNLGIKLSGWKDYVNPNQMFIGQYSMRRSFESLYRFANKVKKVDNIWVWVYNFEYLKDYKHGN